MILSTDNCLFFIIDIQEKLLKAVFNKEVVEKNSSILVKAARILNIPIVVTEQYPQGLGETVNELKEQAQLFIKTDFNALTDKALQEELACKNKKNIIVFGIETHICVHQTVAELLKQGYSVTVVTDACGSRSEIEYRSALNYMQNQKVDLKTTEMILFELIKTAKHPNFKELQSLVK